MNKEQISCQVGVVEVMDHCLGAVMEAAGSAVEKLSNAVAHTACITDAVASAEESIACLQTTLLEQRSHRNAVKTAIRNRRALQVAMQTHVVTTLEDDISRLREESTKLDYDIIACDAELGTLRQQLASACVALETGEEQDALDVATESEHAMFRNDALFAAVSEVPSANRVAAFMHTMACELSLPSDTRTIRALANRPS